MNVTIALSRASQIQQIQPTLYSSPLSSPSHHPSMMAQSILAMMRIQPGKCDSTLPSLPQITTILLLGRLYFVISVHTVHVHVLYYTYIV